MWGGGSGSGWNRLQGRAQGQYDDRQKQQNSWQQQSQGGGASGGGGWNQSGGSQSTQAAGGWDANAYKRAASGGGGGWGGGSGGGFGGGIGRGLGSGQQDQGYSDWLSGAGGGYKNMSNDPRAQKAYQQHQRQGREWDSERQGMDQDMTRREHQRGMQESPEQMMQMFNVMNQMKQHFPEGWGEEFWTRMMAGYMPQMAKGYGTPQTVKDYIGAGRW